jgi:hypothetical protein
VFAGQHAAGPGRPANLARFVFLDLGADRFYRDWDGIAAQTVGSLRAEAGRDPHDRALTQLIGELSVGSQAFRERWAGHDVTYYRSGTQPFGHPVAGQLDLEYNALEVAADPGQTIVAYSAAPGSPSAQALSLLASWAATTDSETEGDARADRAEAADR